MSVTKLRDLPPRLQDRYGYRRTPRIAIVAAVLATCAIVGFGAWTGYRLSDPEVRWKLLAWNAAGPDHTDITFEIRRASDQPIECALRVQDQYHEDLGYAIVSIPGGTPYAQQTYSVATRGSGFVADVLGCSAPGKLTVPLADFPPGTSNPPQPWRP